MISTGYYLTTKDFADFKAFKESSAYATYLKSISSSPAFKTIMNEHVNNVDITDDVKKLKTEGKLPDSVSAKALSDLFKQSIARMAICVVADSIILKELEDSKFQDVMDSLTEESDIAYLLGKADPKFYEQAKQLLNQGKLATNTMGYKGLECYLKQQKFNGEVNNLGKIIPVQKTVEKSKDITKKEDPKINFDSNTIIL